MIVFLFSFLFFFKQKAAYEMRISDWSSDVCSSDLKLHVLAPIVDHENYEDLLSKAEACSVRDLEAVVRGKMSTAPDGIRSIQFRLRRDHYEALSTEERRVGNACVSMCKTRWWAYT